MKSRQKLMNFFMDSKVHNDINYYDFIYKEIRIQKSDPAFI